MSEGKTRRVLSVFLASPGDVGEEREAALHVVDRFNKVYGPTLGWVVEMHRWEDVAPSYGRPQSVINPAVDSCDLFIGLLWERWGSPTGRFTSGFEEEFERARERRGASGGPEIWLVFKRPRADKVQDPGSELTKVLEFRAAQISRREILFREVEGAEDWGDNLLDWLYGLVNERAGAEPGVRQGSTAPMPSPAPEPALGPGRAEATDGASEPALDQLRQLSHRISDVLSTSDPDSFLGGMGPLDELDMARLHLLSASWVAQWHTAGFVGTHEVNLAYKHRGRVAPLATERYQLLRTLLNDRASVVPAWFWLRGMFPDGPLEALLYLARRDRVSALRVAALGILSSSRISIPAERWGKLPISDRDSDVALAAVSLLGRIGDEGALPLIQNLREAGDESLVSAAASEAMIQILLRSDPGRAFRELASSSLNPSADLMQAVTGARARIQDQDLVEAAKSGQERIRAFSVGELARRGLLRVELAETLQGDSSRDVRQAAVQRIVMERGLPELEKLRKAGAGEPTPLAVLAGLSGQPGVDVGAMAAAYYRTLTFEQLQAAVGWLSPDGPLAYRLLAVDYFDGVAEMVREDIRTDFRRVRQAWVDELSTELGAENAKKLLSAAAALRVDAMVLEQFVESALAGLAVGGGPADAGAARAHMFDKSDGVRAQAVRVLARFGGPEDAPALIRISAEAYGELQEAAADAALRLSEDPEVDAIGLAGADAAGQVRAGVRWLLEHDSPAARGHFGELLNDESTNKRAIGAYYMSRKLSKEEMEALLDDYTSRDTYYYDVVTWFDRLLYAPSPLREMFSRDLAAEADIAEVPAPPASSD